VIDLKLLEKKPENGTSYYDDYRGVILYIRVFDGEIKKGAAIQMMATGANGIALEVGALNRI